MSFDCSKCAQRSWTFLRKTGKLVSYGCELLPIYDQTVGKKLDWYEENCPLRKISEMDHET